MQLQLEQNQEVYSKKDEERFQADFEEKYYRYLIQHYTELDTIIKWFLFVTSGASLGTLKFLQSYPLISQLLLTLNTLLAGVNIIINYRSIVDSLVRVHEKCVDRKIQYEIIDGKYGLKSEDEITKYLDEIRRLDKSIDQDTAKIKLCDYCQHIAQRDVFISRKWDIPDELKVDKRSLVHKILRRKP